MEAPLRPLRLRCSVQNYDWGRRGEDSTVARLFERNSGAEIDPSRPYAEFWMGTHESGPSFTGSDSEEVTLKKWIRENPGALGDKVVAKWGTDLPFLFKILSVASALSIQAHPDKELARMLHRMRPNVYKDPNHKPEMAIALTEFKALCGFVSMEELKDVLIGVPEIAELVGNDETNKIICMRELNGYVNAKAVIQSVFTKLMSANKDAILALVSKLKNRLEAENKIRRLSEREQLALLLEKQYHADVGVLAAFFLNYVKLSPGEALYIGPNEPHAYISGECIECMAASDNVVRAGLTPKYIDVPTLCSMLTYKQAFPQILRGIQLNPFITRYTPPFDEFEVDCCILPSKESVVFSPIPGPSIFIIVTGEGRLQTGSTDEERVMEGDVYFVPAHNEIHLSAAPDKPIHLYRSGVNSRIFG
ncbi:mannose-6-phosphate isomerase 1-like isoform X1 [Zingiber officinale]|uniref:mannose-6-phosphate isomerase 1-like isoform X1 n=1 Tax=Zingiber officinale TaxID=94328 RepID=UPI001C4CE0CF|nr:mannose-6-phosphate isomerase 1-like isoform X1 [Zingiber officinale]